MNVYVQSVVGCAGAALFSWVAWVTLDGVRLGVVLGSMAVCAVLFILTALREWQVQRAVADMRFKRPVAPAPVADEDLDFDEPVFDLPPRVFGDEW